MNLIAHGQGARQRARKRPRRIYKNIKRAGLVVRSTHCDAMAAALDRFDADATKDGAA